MRRWYLSTSRSKALLSPFCARATKSVSTSLLFIVYASVIAHYLGRPCPRTQQSHQGAPLLCGMVMPPTHHPALYVVSISSCITQPCTKIRAAPHTARLY